MVDIRIYRAAFIATLLAAVVVMFSLQNRPAPLVNRIAPDAFNGTEAFGMTQDIAVRYPNRKPGGPGNQELAGLVRKRFVALGLETSSDTFSSADKTLLNVIGVLPGSSDRQMVVMAHRDSPEAPGASSAANTAALIEMARALASSSRRHTFVLVSSDGSSLDDAGARHFARNYEARGRIDAMFVLDDIAESAARRPYLIPWSESSNRGSLQILRTSELALQREIGEGAGYQSWAGQFARQAWPLTLREQGPLVQENVNAITFTSSGEVPRPPRQDTLERMSADRLESFGRAALAATLAYDAAPKLRDSPRRYIVAARKVMPGWALALLALGLLTPPVAASVDAFARARRRGQRIGGWVRWVLSSAVPFAITLLATWVFQIAGWLPQSSAEAISPLSKPGFGETAPALVALVLLFTLSWIVLRPAVLGHDRDIGPPGSSAAVALSLVLSIELLLVWAANPLVALLLVPAAHLCLLGALPESPRRALLIAGMVIGPLLLPVLALVYYGQQFDLGFHVGSYLLMLVTSATSSLPTAVLCSLIGGSLVATVLIALAAGGRRERDEITVRGPVSYAGPGSLGGTGSALRR